ncbi:MAG: hypothetical protein LBQ40_00150 [Clostridiales bacterium]|jgi:hypothetical protein|nr:hypothetical protein [Clostridiales bacterium]
MKRIAYALLAAPSLILCVLFPAPPTAASYADGQAKYAVIADDGVMLYGINRFYEYIPLFAVPKTYYVEYAGSNADYHIVRYMDLKSELGMADLFVLKGAIRTGENDLITVASPYPSVVVRNSLGGEVLRLSPSQSAAPSATLTNANSALKYYGSITAEDGSVWHYAGYGGAAGYIQDSALVEPPVVPLHPNAQAVIPQNQEKSGLSGDTRVMTVIIAAGIILPAVLIFLLMFRPGRRNIVRSSASLRPSDAPKSRPREYRAPRYFASNRAAARPRGGDFGGGDFDGERGGGDLGRGGRDYGENGRGGEKYNGYGGRFPYDKY